MRRRCTPLSPHRNSFAIFSALHRLVLTRLACKRTDSIINTLVMAQTNQQAYVYVKNKIKQKQTHVSFKTHRPLKK